VTRPRAPQPVSAAPDELKVRVARSIAEVGELAWSICSNTNNINYLNNDIEQNRSASATESASPSDASLSTFEFPYNPFTNFSFIHALEQSGSVGRRTGWQPFHLAAEGADGEVVGVVPCYVKSHSQGEYVFDHGWADAYERAGGRYYPKLQVSVPFTPATGPRLLAAPGPAAGAVRGALADALVALCGQSSASSVHVTFPTRTEWDLLGAHGFLQRTHQQFHWENDGYGAFEDFLAALASRKRKVIRRERAEALANGISIHWLTGSDLTEEVWDIFFEFYMDTGSRKWGQPYLTREFYSLVGQTMADRILLVMAKRAGRWIAGAINFIGGDTLFGRHWGAVEHHPFLHFEVCYYQAIDFAIARGLARVEAGAQGQHKIARGYMPTTTLSAHYIADPGFRRAVADFLARERAAVAAAQEELCEIAPFRRGEPPE